MDSMQASLETEQGSKAEALRIKKKLEGEISELEIALEPANKANNEALKSIKRYQGQLREADCLFEEASHPVSIRKWQKRQVLLTVVPIHCKVRWRHPEPFLIPLKEARDILRLKLERPALLLMK